MPADDVGGSDEVALGDDSVSLFQGAPCGYLATTLSGRILWANRTMLTWLGESAGAVVGRQLTDFLGGGGKIYYETHYAPMLAMQGAVHEIAVDLRRHDGSRLPVLLNASSGRDSATGAELVRIALFDATERRMYEQELLAAKDAAETALAEAEVARDEARDARARAGALARTLQQSLIPPATPDIPGLDVAAGYRPAGDGSEVGGDFYDVFSHRSGEWFVVLGDVCGKGVEAAVVTALARYTVRALTSFIDDPADVLHELNEAVYHHETDRFCSVVLVRLRPEGRGWTASLASGGHLPPLLLAPGEPSAVATLEIEGHLIGIFPDRDFAGLEVALPPGASLLLFTDGVTEARSGAAFYGSARVTDLALGNAGSASNLVEALVDDVLAFQGGNARDDIAVLAVTVPEPGPVP